MDKEGTVPWGCVHLWAWVRDIRDLSICQRYLGLKLLCGLLVYFQRAFCAYPDSCISQLLLGNKQLQNLNIHNNNHLFFNTGLQIICNLTALGYHCWARLQARDWFLLTCHWPKQATSPSPKSGNKEVCSTLCGSETRHMAKSNSIEQRSVLLPWTWEGEREGRRKYLCDH